MLGVSNKHRILFHLFCSQNDFANYISTDNLTLFPHNYVTRHDAYMPVAVIVLCFFLKVQWIGLLCVIVAFPGHTHLPFSFMIYHFLSYDVPSGSEITPCNKIDKPLVVYRFMGNVMTSITTLRT